MIQAIEPEYTPISWLGIERELIAATIFSVLNTSALDRSFIYIVFIYYFSYIIEEYINLSLALLPTCKQGVVAAGRNISVISILSNLNFSLYIIPAINVLSKEMTLAFRPSKSVVHCPFLKLLLYIRRQIYYKASVPRGQLIDLNQYRESLKEYPLYNDLYNSSTYYLPLLAAVSLLTVCHMVHDEVMCILYRENCFELTEYLHRPYLNICVLLSMGNAAIREMRYLTVRLRSESCVESCCGRSRDRCSRGTERCDYSQFHQRPFNDE